MASTDMRQRSRRPVNTSNVLGIPVSSQTPVTSDSMVFDSTTGYYEMKKIISSDVTQSQLFTGNNTFSGTMKIGANGTPLNELRFGSASLTNPALASGAFATNSVTFTPAFSAAPNVQLIAQSSSGVDAACTIIVLGAPTSGGFTWRMSNENTVATMGNFTIHWIAYV